MKMILIVMVFIFGVFLSSITTAAIILNTDDVYEFEFNTLTFDRNTNNFPTGFFSCVTGGPTVLGGEFYLEVFEDSLDETPAFTHNYVMPNAWPQEYAFAASVTEWQDLQGAFRLTMTSGSLSLNKIFVEVCTGDSVYNESFIPVPEPTTLLLLTLGAVFIRRK
jgi:PEP-CTERM motif